MSTTPTPSPAPSSTPAPAAGPSYKDTLNLPKTAFPMKANLVQNEPATIKRWQAMKLYERLREARKGRPAFVFHDGPPYANGNIHLGHLLNKCLKDMVVRSRSMMGLDCPYVPGWDCHGLPIEHKVMTEMQEKGKLAKLATLPEDQRKMIVRRECQAYAEKYVKLQRGQMERLLTVADYDHPYLTLQPSFEGATLEVLADLCSQGLVYRALKPVHWSIANETALAEAELEYQDREDLSVYVDFEAADMDAVYDAFGLKEAEESDEATERRSDEGGAEEPSTKVRVPAPGSRPLVRPSFMIWTTTPWTLPANLAIAVNPKFEYACVWADGAVTVVALDAVNRVMKMPTGEHKVEQFVVLGTCTGEKLLGLKYRHPFVGPAEGAQSEAFRKREKVSEKAPFHTVVGADYVTLEDGTGLVHTAPGHGTEDYQTGQREHLPSYCPVKGDGTYDDTVPAWLVGMSIWKANDEVTRHLKGSGHLFFSHKFTHSYPHDWRSKTPVIFRCTHQWFVAVDKPMARWGASLRELALKQTAASGGADITFVPEWGRNRMRGMLESRPDWCISRQRAWGMPIPAFLLPDDTVFMTAASVKAVAKLVREKGTDVWFTAGPEELLKYYDVSTDPDCPPSVASSLRRSLADLRKGGDIVDVWFESGSTWNACMRERGLGFPMDLYLEGSDQHRGWFQSSLLPSLGVTGVPPFKTLLTHGFIVDKDGKKLSKSRPDAQRYEVEALCNEFGMDVMRWWVASLPYENDIKADLSFFAEMGESYRKVRNTLRFMLSNLSDFSALNDGKPGNRVDLSSAPAQSLDAWVMAEFDRLSEAVEAAYIAYDFRAVQQKLYDFCNDTLSATYLAAVKDRLYCDRANSERRRRTQTVLWDLTDGLCRLLAPVLCHTTDEAWRDLHKADPKDALTCVHLAEFVRAGGRPGYGVRADARWAKVLELRQACQGVLERAKGTHATKITSTNPKTGQVEEKIVFDTLDFGLALPGAGGALAGFDPTDLADLMGVSRVEVREGIAAPELMDLRGEAQCQRSWKRDGTVKPRRDGGVLSDRDAEAVGVG